MASGSGSAQYRTRSDTLKLQRLIEVLKERGSDLAGTLESKAKDFLADVKPKKKFSLIPHYEEGDDSDGSSFVPDNEEEDWGSDWEEWVDEDEEGSASAKENNQLLEAGRSSSPVKDIKIVEHTLSLVETLNSGEKLVPPDSMDKEKGNQSLFVASVKAAANTVRRRKSATLSTVDSVKTTVIPLAAAISPLAAVAIATASTATSVAKLQTKSELAEPPLESDSSSRKAGKEESLKFPTLPVNIPDAFDVDDDSYGRVRSMWSASRRKSADLRKDAKKTGTNPTLKSSPKAVQASPDSTTKYVSSDPAPAGGSSMKKDEPSNVPPTLKMDQIPSSTLQASSIVHECPEVPVESSSHNVELPPEKESVVNEMTASSAGLSVESPNSQVSERVKVNDINDVKIAHHLQENNESKAVMTSEVKDTTTLSRVRSVDVNLEQNDSIHQGELRLKDLSQSHPCKDKSEAVAMRRKSRSHGSLTTKDSEKRLTNSEHKAESKTTQQSGPNEDRNLTDATEVTMGCTVKAISSSLKVTSTALNTSSAIVDTFKESEPNFSDNDKEKVLILTECSENYEIVSKSVSDINEGKPVSTLPFEVASTKIFKKEPEPKIDHKVTVDASKGHTLKGISNKQPKPSSTISAPSTLRPKKQPNRVSQAQPQAYTVPEGLEIPSVGGARSRKPTLASQWRQQREKQFNTSGLTELEEKRA